MRKIFYLCLLALTVVALTGCRGSSYLESYDLSADTAASSESEDISTEYDTETEPNVTVGYVQITGAVANPGVFEIDGETRLFEVIERAGGLLNDADIESINQASRVSDGDNIRIRTVEESAALKETNGSDSSGTSPGNPETVDGKLNINAAGKESLMTLPGIGESKADSIIEYRDTNGPFKDISDIKKIPGIKDGVYLKIKDEITVG